MGLILDSSVLIAAERKARPVSELLATIRVATGLTAILLSAVSVIELEHGLWRANGRTDATPKDLSGRNLCGDPCGAFTKQMGQLAAKIDAEARKQGVVIPFSDLQIGVTALHFDYAIGTLNVRHFEMIPGLQVTKL